MPPVATTTEAASEKAQWFAAEIDNLVKPEEIRGIEVYRGESDTPAEFGTRWVQCGTVVIWTRRGFRERG